MEKRNIQISLEEAREWYNSGNSFKKELALKAYSETELSINIQNNRLALLKDEVKNNSREKAGVYRKLLNISKYYNNLYPIKYDSHLRVPIYYTIPQKWESAYFTKYKDFFINKSVCKSPYEIVFNSEEAAKKAIDILGEELNVLFE